MANTKEAKARIKINELLEQADWRLFDNEKGQAKISLEPNVKFTQKDIDAFGENFESTKNGFIDFLLLDEKGFPKKNWRDWSMSPTIQLSKLKLAKTGIQHLILSRKSRKHLK